MKRIIYTLACLLLSVGAWAQGEVAQIGETKYATLAEAISAVPTDGTETTITMLEDADITTALTIANTQNVVIDLNGKTVKNDASKSLAQLITVNGKLTISDSSEPSTGVIKNTASGKYVIKTGTAASVLTLNNGTIETTTGNSNGAVYGSYGSFVMTGGKIIAAGTGVTSKNVTISGGEITATAGQALCAAGTITGGTFASTNNSAAYANQSGTLEITGGTFTGVSSKPTINVNTTDVKVTGVTLANGVGFVSNATAMLLPGTDDAYLTNTQAEFYDGETLVGYAPINTGLFANNKVAGKTVKLTEDVATTTYINVTKNFTLDLNGHNIACTPAKADAAILTKGTVSAPVELTIKGEGQISCADHGEGCNAIQVSNYSTVNIEGGNYSVPGDNATIYIASSIATNPTTVNITGGSYHSGDGKWILNIKDDAAAAGAKINVTGGKFYNFDPANNTVDGNSDGNGTNYVPDNYVTSFTMDGSNKVYEVSEGTWVAKIEGGVGSQFRFATLAEAIAATPDGVETTITLLANTTENVTIPAGKDIVLELNGKTLSGGSVASKAAIVNNGTITIQDSSAEQTGTVKREDDDTNLSASSSYYVIDNHGTMTIKSGNIINNSGLTTAHKGSSLIRNGEPEAAVLNIEGGTLTQNNFDVIKNGGKGTLNISGGTINSSNSYAVLSYSEMNMTAGTVYGNVCLRSYTDSKEDTHGVGNISGGTINGNITVETYTDNTPNTLSECNISGTAVINGILSVGEGNGNSFTANDEKGTIAVSGGTFSYQVPEKYCAEGFSPVTTPNADGKYTVETTKVAMIGDVYYASLEDAIDAATDGATIKLIRDGLKYEYVEPNKTITLDLNGFTYDCNIDNYGTLIVVDNSEEGTGKLVNSVKHWIVWNNPTGKLTIESGTIAIETKDNNNNGSQYAIANEGEIIINGGKIDGYTTGYSPSLIDTYPDTYALFNNAGKVAINGGELYAIHSLGTFDGGTVTITDGLFQVPFGEGCNAVYNYSDITVNISGGTFVGDTDYLINMEDHSAGTFNITGGKFFKYNPQHSKSEHPEANFVPKEYAAQQDAEGYFVIVPAIAYIDKMGYAVLDDAIEEVKGAESATTVTLLADAETTKEVLPANVTINANEKVLTMPSFVVLDGEAFTLPNVTGADTYKVRKATYIRTNISATEWGTVCLPFSLTSGNGADYYTYKNITGSTLNVDETNETVAPNTPVVFNKTTDDLEINEENATVSLNATPIAAGALVGTYTDANIPANGSIYFINGDKFHKAQVSVKVPMYRAYINYTASAAKPDVLNLNVIGIGNADGIESVVMDATNGAEAIYDVNGRQLTAPQKGLNIMKLANGKTVKVMLK